MGDSTKLSCVILSPAVQIAHYPPTSVGLFDLVGTEVGAQVAKHA
jgi:hypothetical protein